MTPAELLAADLADDAPDARRRAAHCATEACAVLELMGARPITAPTLDELGYVIDFIAAELLADAHAEVAACDESLLRRTLSARVSLLDAAASMGHRALRLLIESRRPM